MGLIDQTWNDNETKLERCADCGVKTETRMVPYVNEKGIDDLKKICLGCYEFYNLNLF